MARYTRDSKAWTIAKAPVTQKTLQQLFHYNPITGILSWKVQLLERNPIGSNAGRLDSLGYYRTCFGGNEYMTHVLIWWLVTGEKPKEFIDHINNQTADNVWDNLREATNTQNQHNSLLNINNSSGVKG